MHDPKDEEDKRFRTAKVDLLVRLRTEKGWNQEELADEAKVSLDTIKRAEKGKRLQIGKIAAIAAKLGLKVSGLIEDSSDKTNHGPGGAALLRSWSDADDIVSHAKTSIVIVDSFFSQYCELDELVAEAFDNGALALDIDIFMTSRDKCFGPQRIKEKKSVGGTKGKDKLTDAQYRSVRLFLEADISDGDVSEYKGKLRDIVNELDDHIGKHKVNLSIFEYPAMPSIRLILVDDSHMIAGWFPLLDQNPGFPCLHFAKDLLDEVGIEAFKALETQIKHVRGVSKPKLVKLYNRPPA